MASRPDNSLPTVAAYGGNAGREYALTYDQFYTLAVQQGMSDQAARVYAQRQASAFHADPQSRTDGAPSADMEMDPGLGPSPMTRDVKRQFHDQGLPTETVPGPRTASGLPPTRPVQFSADNIGMDEARSYVERQGTVDPQTGGTVYKPSQRDEDMAARGMVAVYRDDGSVGYAPGMYEEPVSPNSPAQYRGGTGRAGRRMDLERNGWRLVAEDGPTGRVYVYRMQPRETPVGDPGGALQKLPASPERLSPAASTGTDYKGREIMSMPGRPGMPSMVEPHGNTFERSQAFRARQRDKARAARAGIDPIEAAKMSEDEVLRRGDRARNAREASAREQITLQTKRLGYATPATMAEAALIYQMTPEQRARLAAFQAAGGRGATPNDMGIADARAAAQVREQELAASMNKDTLDAQSAEAEAARKRGLTPEDAAQEAIRENAPSSDPRIMVYARQRANYYSTPSNLSSGRSKQGTYAAVLQDLTAMGMDFAAAQKIAEAVTAHLPEPPDPDDLSNQPFAGGHGLTQ